VGRSQLGEIHLVEKNMTRDKYAVGDEVKTAIPHVVRGVTEEEAASERGDSLWGAVVEVLG
jgi:hypothetical protein